MSIIALLVLLYGGNTLTTILFSAAYGAIVFAITQPGLVPEEVLWYGQAANIPMIVVGKLIQAATNFKNGHTGQLSAITVFLLTAGSLARIFTSIQETGDQVMILTFVVSSSVNVIIALQVLYYWNTTKQVLKKEAKKESQENAIIQTAGFCILKFALNQKILLKRNSAICRCSIVTFYHYGNGQLLNNSFP